MSTPTLPLTEEAAQTPEVELKPTWRGWLHLGMTPLVVVSGLVLLALGEGAEARLSSLVFVLTSLLLFGNSALYHRVNWRPRAKAVFRRIDHANIFLLIAGTYTPVSFLALPERSAWTLMAFVWGGALLGILFNLFWLSAPRWVYVPLYLALGWAAIFSFGPLFEANAAMMILLLIGGVFYTLGAVAYGLKRPNPFPGRFGFHEVFHTGTVLAYICHWSAVLLIALAPQ